MGRNILIAPIGTEGQVVTTAIDLLTLKKMKPDEVIVLHSAGDPKLEAAAAKLNEELAKQPETAFSVKPFSRGGMTVGNLDSAEQIDIIFYCLYNEVRKAKARGDTVHLLCSGGRKIIAAYAMLTAQMLFDPKDNLWYLISRGAYLDSKAFHPETGDDFRQTKLLRIPFLTWNALLPSVSSIGSIGDPYEAFARIEALQLDMKYRKAEEFVERVCTKSERKVLKLFAMEGMTNAGIAGKLFISERTVEDHMSSMLGKAAFFWGTEEITRSQLALLAQPYYQMKLEGK